MRGMADPYLKIRWAKAHLQTLNAHLLSFSAPATPTMPAKSYTTSAEEDVEHGRYIFRLTLTPVPSEICLIAGDAIYNMRAALDQTVWSLARLGGVPGLVQWPTVEAPTRKSLERFEKQVAGVPNEAFCEIKAFQPYHRGDAFKSHPLWRLNELCNLDKHRRIPANGSFLDGRLPGITQDDVTSGRVILEASDDCHIISIPLAMKEKFNFKPSAPVTVNFGGDQSGISETPNGIAEIYNFVALEVLPRFDRFFT